jgi:hypothetical protein
MSSEPVAVVKLPARGPYGFHALFVNEVSKQLLVLVKCMRLLLLNIGRNLENMGMTQRIWALIFRSNCNHRGETFAVDGCSVKSLSIIVSTCV